MLWVSFLLLGENNYIFIEKFLNSFLGKFIILGLTWSFSFQILSEIRHLIMDLGYGFELKTTRITGFNCYSWINYFNCIFFVMGKILFNEYMLQKNGFF